ncbi:aminoacyl-histidine dipeptidase [Butyrivibrio proteoclasticus]|uniref:aminoacyl-histidine dipeptidase n=1 Tax=Butyrivibrio proteoclasticus TaxID=43305 RepID=UPI00047EF348|nr:aminoacyl-histidine dipeptidase [Butyrivibrio proteoclasticus]
MAVLDNIEPKEVFHFFENICNIPHGSGNVQKISDYLVSFAKERNLEVIQDEKLNVIIKAPGSKGYEDREPVILQGHMDMVAVKRDDCDIDMTTEGLRVKTDGEYVWAEGTSLGGDDGIAVAYCLALLDSDTIPHPPLEVVITTDEETGMFGAAAIDLSSLKSKKLINIDNEEEGVLLTSCAGGARVYTTVATAKETVSGTKCKVSVAGLLGGHSGEMIIKGRGNAIRLVARALKEASEKAELRIASFDGGVADNAIPSTASATVVVKDSDVSAFEESIKASAAAISAEYEIKDPDVKLSSEVLGKSDNETVITLADTDRVLNTIFIMPDGVQAMSAAVAGLVETSLNLGIITTKEDCVVIEHSVRSSVETAKEELIMKLVTIGMIFGAKVSVSGQYPGWQFRPHSELRDHMVEVYKKLYGKEPKIEAIHAGLECGLLSQKIDDLDCISIGPDMKDIHSPNEKLSIRSTANVWDYIKAVLA